MCGPDTKPGILPSEIRQLVESRRVVKNMMKNPGISPDLRLQVNMFYLFLFKINILFSLKLVKFIIYINFSHKIVQQR